MDVQSELFAIPQPPTPLPGSPPSLLIRLDKQPNAQLSKAQKAFNRLVREIEALRRGIESDTRDWDKALTAYARDLRPAELEVAAARKTIIRSLRPFLQKDKKLKPRQRQTLTEVLLEQIQGVLQLETVLDDDLRQVHEELQKAPPSPRDKAQFKAMRDEMEDFCRAMGVDLDLSEIRPDMTEAELDAKLREIEGRVDAREDGAPAGRSAARPKSKRELDREQREREAEELRSRNLNTLYRQLAKLLHPDLEQDPVRRHEKEQSMKELTVAYKAGDLHALLRMEIQFILREEADAARLTDEKLKVYNEVLREQVNQLREERFAISAHPRYAPLRPYLLPFASASRFDAKLAARELRELVALMTQSIERLRSPQASQEVVEILGDYRSRPRYPMPF